MEKLKILISAYACKPNEGSEPGVGWNTAVEIAKYNQVWVFTRACNQAVIESELSKHPISGLNFVYCNLPFWARWWKPTQLPHYYLWQICAYLTARNLHRDIKFDVAHHLTYVRYWAPSFLSFLPIPFIWGPVGGGESTPKEFWTDFNLRSKVYETLRLLVRWSGEIIPFTYFATRRSRIAFTTTEDTARKVKNLGATNVQILSESGLSLSEIESLGKVSLSDSSFLRFISIGRLIHWKGFHLGIRAFAQANLPKAEYWIVGDGVEQERLKTLAENLGVGDKVKFWGRLPRTKTLETLGQCDVLVHPSLHDSGGWVCLEAMAAARPVICLDLGGPGEQVIEQTGLKIPVENPKQTVADLAIAMSKIAADPALRIRMGESGREHIRKNYTWYSKGKMFTKLYQNICSSQTIEFSQLQGIEQISSKI